MTDIARFNPKLDTANNEILSAKEKAVAVNDEESRITLSYRNFAAFTEALNQAFAPNATLQKALLAAATVERALTWSAS
jgi:uncharacterized protein (DUF1778 family)